jgi:hypothetical protein
MNTFLLNLLGSLMLFYGLFSYTSGVVRAVTKKEPFTSLDAIVAIFCAAVGLSIFLTF